MRPFQYALSALDAWVESYKAPAPPALLQLPAPQSRSQGGAPAGGEAARYGDLHRAVLYSRDAQHAPGTAAASDAVASRNAATAPVPYNKPYNNSLGNGLHGDGLNERIAHKLRALEEQQAIMRLTAAKRGVRGEQGKDEAWEALGRNRIAGERKSAAERDAEMNEVRAQWEDHITRRLGPGGKSTHSPSPDTDDKMDELRAQWECQFTGSFSRANLSVKSTEDAKIQPGNGNRVSKDASVEWNVVKRERPKLAASTPRSRETTDTMNLTDLIARGDASVPMAVHPSFKVH